MKRKALIFQNAEGEGPGILADCLDRRPWDKKISDLYLGESIPEDWKNYSLLMVMGGPMNVYEEDTYPYLKEETAIIKEAINMGLPVLGFCLGAQLMAKACGAKVVKGDKKEIGWYRVQLAEHGIKDPLLKSFPKDFTVFQWHGDTFNLPHKAVRLARSVDCANQAMQIGHFSYGFQFHFEVTKEMIGEWLINGREEIEELGKAGLAEKILADTDRFISSVHSLCRNFFENYLNKIEAL